MTAELVAPHHPPVIRNICFRCGTPARLYPGGWLCDQHAPNPALTAAIPPVRRLRVVKP